MFKVVKNFKGGPKLIETPKFEDNRGFFYKTYNYEEFKEISLNFKPKEQFFSVSNENVLRGMHFQTKGYAHEKLVTCLSGKVLDVIVDLRTNSKYFKNVISIELDSANPYSLYIPIGFAHGFVSFKNNTLMQYLTSSVYNQNFDAGVHWKSINFKWPNQEYLVSERDMNHPNIEDLKCEFF